jgi:hypothetical protein
MSKELPPDATLADVLPTLAKPVDYVCGVLANLYQCREKHGSAEVVIGTSGKGLRPCYRIRYEAAGSIHVFDTYWDNHVSFHQEQKPIEGGVSWSGKAMSLDDVGKLRSTSRG